MVVALTLALAAVSCGQAEGGEKAGGPVSVSDFTLKLPCSKTSLFYGTSGSPQASSSATKCRRACWRPQPARKSQRGLAVQRRTSMC